MTAPTRTEETPRRRISDRHRADTRTGYAGLTDEDLLAEHGTSAPARQLRLPDSARTAVLAGWGTARERWAGLALAYGAEHAGPRRGMRAATDVACLLVGLALALTPLLPVYGSATAIPALVGGLVVGAGIAALGAWRRWSGLGVVAALVVGYLLVGGPLAAQGTAREL